MHFSVTVPYDEQRLRRTLRFIARPQVGRIRIWGSVLMLLGVIAVLLAPETPISYTFVVLGFVFVVGIGPLIVGTSMRGRSRASSIETRMTVDDEWLSTSSALSEGRIRWAAFDRIVEAPEGWFLTLGKFQAFMVPKAPMTEAERAEFAAFVNRLPVAKR